MLLQQRGTGGVAMADVWVASAGGAVVMHARRAA